MYKKLLYCFATVMLVFLCASSQSIIHYNGDLNHNGRIDDEDALKLSRIILQQDSAELIVADGDELRFTTDENVDDLFNGHEFVDLGLRDERGRVVCWATCNVGADNPEDSGLYFAWGDINGRPNPLNYSFSWQEYSLMRPRYDPSRPLTYDEDAACQMWGGHCRMPSHAEQEQLVNDCDWTWTSLNGKTGYKVSNRQDSTKYIFLPAAGYRFEQENYGSGGYWSVSFSDCLSNEAYGLTFTKNAPSANSLVGRCAGLTIRAVCVMYGVEAYSIALNKSSKQLYVGNKFNLIANIVPNDVSSTVVRWSSSDTSVATVNPFGEVTAVGLGNAVITASLTDGSGLSSSCSVTVESIDDPFNGYDYVDLGLKDAGGRSIYWATCNVGSQEPMDIGLAFAWGETNGYAGMEALGYVGMEAISFMTWANYKYAKKDFTSWPKITKYNGTDGRKILERIDDAANWCLQGYWRMPTYEEFRQLIDDCDWEWFSELGQTGYKVYNKNDRSKFIVLPCIGYRWNVDSWEREYKWSDYEGICQYTGSKDDSIPSWGDATHYWSSTLAEETPKNAYALWMDIDSYGITSMYGRNHGFLVRAVCVPDAAVDVEISLLELNLTATTINVDDEIELAARINPVDASTPTLVWTTSDETVAIVSPNGAVKAIGVGSSIIRATATDGSGKYAECRVDVSPALVKSITISDPLVQLLVGSSMPLTVTVLPTYAGDPSVTWTSSDDDIVVVSSNGELTAVGVGSAVISAVANDGSGIVSTCEVTVLPINVSSVRFDVASLQLPIGDQRRLAVEVLPVDATNAVLTWSSTDESVIKVSADGTVSAVGIGSATIKASSTDGSGKESSCVVTVMPIQVSAIELNETNIDLVIGSSTTLVANVLPSNATQSDVEWSTSNASVIRVDADGFIKAVGLGTATVSAAAVDGSGIVTTCQVTVLPIPVRSIILSESDVQLQLGMNISLTANVAPVDATNTVLSWATSDSRVATITPHGLLMAVGVGEAIITVSATDGSGVSDVCEVKVLPVLISSLTLDVESLKLDKGQSYGLTATVSPANVTNRELIWTTSDADVATVSQSGEVTAVGSGQAIIKVTSADGSGKEAVCTVTSTIKVSTIELSEMIVQIEKEESKQLLATVLPVEADSKELEWTSSNSDVVTVGIHDGIITGRGLGNATIIATATDGSGVVAKCEVTVVPQRVRSIVLSASSAQLQIGSGLLLTAVVTPLLANQGLEWTSSDDSVVSVDREGALTAVGIGTAFVTATAIDGSGVSAVCEVKVLPVLISSLTLDVESLKLDKGQSYGLTATVLPANATNRELIWTTSDADVATVSQSGEVTAVGSGQAIIKITSADGSGKEAVCTVTSTIKVSSIELSEMIVQIEKEESKQLLATVLPVEADSKELEWTSSNSDVVTVGIRDGIITGRGVGNATIIATATDGSGVVAKCEVTVVPQRVRSIVLSASSAQLQIGSGLSLTAVVTPLSANQGLEWTSSDDSVVSVDREGALTAVGIGTAFVTATAIDGSGVSAVCEVNVIPIMVTSVVLDDAQINLEIGYSTDLPVKVYPSNAANTSLNWKTSDASIAVVTDQGRVTAIGVGTATVSAVAADGSGRSASCKVIVTTPFSYPLDGQSITQIDMMQGQSRQMMENSGIQYDWVSSDMTVATVTSDGTLSAVSEGSAFVVARLVGDGRIVTSYRVSVFPLVKISSITLSESLINGIEVGCCRELSVKVLPSTVINPMLEWTTSDASVAVVTQDGLITAVGSGRAVVTAAATDGSGKTASCTIVVTSAQLYPNNHKDFVDLGVKDSQGRTIYWAKYNLGASKPEDTGLFYAWGVTTGYPSSGHTFLSFNYEFEGDPVLKIPADAASKDWCGAWRMPSYDEFYSLLLKCTWTWTTENGMPGFRVSNKSDNSQYIFLPAAGSREGSQHKGNKKQGHYWTTSGDPSNRASYIYFTSTSSRPSIKDGLSYHGRSIRPVFTMSTIQLMTGESKKVESDSTLSYNWFSSDSSVITVAADGTVTAVSAGTAYVVAKSVEDGRILTSFSVEVK